MWAITARGRLVKTQEEASGSACIASHCCCLPVQAVEKGLSTTRETMACNKRLLTQKTAWASHTLKLLQVMLAAQDPTTSASTTHAGSQACTTAAPSPTDSAVADCTSQSSQPGPAEPNTALPLSSSTTQGGLAASPVESEAASSPQEDEDSNPQNNADLDRILSRILSMAKLQRLAEKVKLLGAEYFRVAGADCTPRSDADRWSGGTSTEGEDDFNWVPQCASLHLTLQMPDPRVVAAAGSLLRGPELTAERVGQFFLQVGFLRQCVTTTGITLFSFFTIFQEKGPRVGPCMRSLAPHRHSCN